MRSSLLNPPMMKRGDDHEAKKEGGRRPHGGKGDEHATASNILLSSP